MSQDLTKTKDKKEVQDKDLIYGLTKSEVEVVKNTVAKGASDEELKLFLYTAHNKGLDPMTGQIHFVKRGGSMTIQTGIDGYRAIAERSGNLISIGEPQHTEAEQSDKTALEKKLNLDFPKKSKVVVTRTRENVEEPVEVSATARWNEYKKVYNGNLGRMWKKMPYLMLGKCAEALALRKAFPQNLSGLYTNAEMSQADNVVSQQPKNNNQQSNNKNKLSEEEKKKKEIFKLTKQLCEVTGVDTPEEKSEWKQMIEITAKQDLKPENYDSIIDNLVNEIEITRQKQNDDGEDKQDETIEGEVVDEADYPCPKCDEAFKNEGVLDMHLQKEHPENQEENEKNQARPDEFEFDKEYSKMEYSQLEEELEKKDENAQQFIADYCISENNNLSEAQRDQLRDNFLNN
jgi:phage recombination protein Bet